MSPNTTSKMRADPVPGLASRLPPGMRRRAIAGLLGLALLPCAAHAQLVVQVACAPDKAFAAPRLQGVQGLQFDFKAQTATVYNQSGITTSKMTPSGRTITFLGGGQLKDSFDRGTGQLTVTKRDQVDHYLCKK